jgi:hypothetical protein
VVVTTQAAFGLFYQNFQSCLYILSLLVLYLWQ